MRQPSQPASTATLACAAALLALFAQAAARSPPDGYTVLAAMDTTMVLNPLVTPNLPYEPLTDFAPITLLTKTVALLVVRSDGPKT
jgi:tripartite-type tricarboxylate transporter receptor subunit TctC